MTRFSRILFVALLGVFFASGTTAQAQQTPKSKTAVPARAVAAPPVSAAAPVDAFRIATDRVQDLSTTLVIVETDKAVLEKMGGGKFKQEDFVKRMKIAYKQPGKVRLEANVFGIGGTLVFDGDTRYTKALFKKDTKNLHGQPGQKQSLRDFGIFAKDWLTSDWEPIFVRRDGGLVVYRLKMRNTTNNSHDIAWVDPKTALIVRRQQYNGDNILQKETRYTQPQQIHAGIWVSRRVELYNAEGKRASVQVFENMKVNAGVSDNMFRL